MSGNIDNRIVQMQFDNAQFEKGVAQTSKSLAKFKKDLDFKDSEKSLERLQRAGDSFSLAKMAHGIDELGRRFSTMGIIGMRVLQNLTDKAMAMGTAFVKSVSIDQITSGFAKYADKTKAVQTIMAATGDDIGNINSQLNRLAIFTDETSYNFVDMVSNIGKFTSMGIDLKTSVTAMEGIANWAAVSGQGVNEASRAMYNLSQALGTGSVQIRDWMSIENANMGTKEFKETAIETAKALGKLDKAGKTAKGTEVTFKNFRETLNQKWLTNDVLLATLQKYGEYGDEVMKIMAEEGISCAKAMEKVNSETMKLGEKAFKAAQEAKTFQEAIDATKDAVSTGWMQAFETIFGNYQEAKVLWTDLANDLYDIFVEPMNSLNELLDGWKELGGRTALVNGLTDSMAALKGVIDSIGDGFHQIFPPTTAEDIKKISDAIEKTGKKLKELFAPKFLGTKTVYEEYLERIDPLGSFEDSLSKGSKGDAVKKLQERLKEAGFDPGSADGIFGPKTEKALNEFKKKYGMAIDGVYDEAAHSKLGYVLSPIDSFQKKLKAVEEDLYKYPKGYQFLSRAMAGTSAVAKILGKVFGFLGGAIKRVFGVLSPLGDVFLKIADAAARFFTALYERLDKSKKFQEWLDFLDTKLEPVRKKIESLGNSLLDLLGIGGDLDEIDFSKVVDNLIASIKKFLGLDMGDLNLAEAIDEKKTVATIKEKITSIFTTVKNWIAGLFSGEGGPEDPTKLINFDGYNLAITGITAIVGILTTRVLQAVGVVVKAGTRVNKILKHVDQTIKGFRDKKNFDSFESASKSILMLAGAIAIIAASIYVLSRLDGKQIVKGLIAIATIMAMLALSVYAFKWAAKGFKDIEKTMLSLVMLAGAIAALGVVILMLSKLDGKQILQGLGSIATLLVLSVGAIAVLNKIGVNAKSVGGIIGLITSLAASLNLMVNVVKNLGLLDTNTLIKGFIGLTGLLMLIAMFFQAVNKISIPGRTSGALIAAAIAIDAIIAGFLVLSFAMKLLKPKDIVKGMTALGAIVLGMVALLKVLNRINPSPKAILSLLPMAIALDLIVVAFIAMTAVMKFAKAKDIAKGIIGIAAMVLGMIAVMKLIEKVKPNARAILALLPISIAIALMVGSFAALLIVVKRVKWGDMAKAIVGLGAVVIALHRLSKLVEKNKPSIRGVLALIPMALALDLLIAGFVILAIGMKKVSIGSLAKAIIAMAAVVIAMNTMATALSKVAPGIKGSISMLIASVAMVGAMVAFSLVLRNIKDVKTAKILAFAGGLAAIMFAFSFIAGTAAVVGPQGILMGALAVLALGAALAILVGAVLGIMKIPGVSEFLTSGAEKLGEVIGTFIGSMKAADMRAFAKGLEGFEDVADVDENSIKNTLKVAQLIADFSEKLPKKSFAKKVGDLFAGTDMEHFAWDMSTLAKGFDAFSKNMGKITIPKDLKKKVQNAIGIANLIVKFNKELPEYSGWEKMGIWKTNMQVFTGTDLQAFADGLNAYSVAMESFPNDSRDLKSKTASAVEIAKTVNGLNSELPAYSPLTQLWFWKTNMQIFTGMDLQAFADGLLQYSDVMQGFPDDSSGLEGKTRAAVGIAEMVNALNNGLPSYSVFTQLWFWKTNMQIFTGTDLQAFAEGINSYAEAMYLFNSADGLDEKTKYAIEIAKQVNSLNSELPGYTVLTQLPFWKTNMQLFAGKDMLAFAQALNEYSANMSTVIDPSGLEEATSHAVNIVKQVNSLNLELPAYSPLIQLPLWKTNMQIFAGKDMAAFGQALNDYNANMSTINDPSALETATGYAIRIAQQINALNTDLPEYSAFVKIGLIKTAMAVFSGDISSFAKGMNDFASQIGQINDPGELDKKASYALSIAKSLSEFTKGGLPEYSLVETALPWLTGMKTFVGDFTSFGEGVNSFAKAMGDISVDEGLENKTASAVEIANQVATFLSDLTSVKMDYDKGALDKFFGDATSQETVFSAVSKLATTMKQASDDLGALPDGTTLQERITSAVEAAKSVSEFMIWINAADTVVPTTLDTRGTMNFENALAGIFRIGETIGKYSGQYKDIDTEYITKISSLVESIKKIFGGTDPSVEISSDTFLKDLDASKVAEKLNSFVTELGSSVQTNTETLAGFSQQFNSSGSGLVDAMAGGMSSNTRASNAAADLATSAANAAKGKTNAFQVVGNQLSAGLARGISQGRSRVVNAAAEVVSAAITRAKTKAEIASPSRVMMGVGKFFSLGFANGITKYGKAATKSSENMVDSSINTVSGMFSSLSSLADDNIDVQPTIAPVVDMSNIRTASGYMNGVFADRSFGVRTSLMASSIATSAGTATKAGQFGSPDVVSAIHEMNARIGVLGEQISNLKMVVDTGALVGQMAGPMDAKFGTMATMKGRMG